MVRTLDCGSRNPGSNPGAVTFFFKLSINRSINNLLNIVKQVELPGKRYCEACQQEQPYRSRHCWDCNRCVRKFDHHCFWIGGCVGELNHGKFWLFLFTQTLSEIIAVKLAFAARD